MKGATDRPRFRYKLLASETEPAVDTTVIDVTESGAGGSVLTAPLLKGVLFASLGAFLFGYHLGVVNGPLDAIAADLGFAANAVLQGTVVSSLLAGAAVGSLSGGSLADAFGRRAALGFDTILMVAGALLSFMANNLNFMIAGRLIAGVAIGVSSAIVPLYISEVSPTSIRGALGSINQLAICIGILGALCVNVILPATAWRTMFLLSIIPAILLAVGMAICPESPRWLANKGRKEDAHRVMQELWKEVDDSLDTSSKSEGGHAGSVQISKKHVKVFAIACALFLFQQFSGINAIVYFSTKVFNEAGMTNDTLASAAVGFTNVCGTILASTLMDKAGRKQLLSLSYLGMGIAMAAMVIGFSQASLAAYSGTVALFGTLLYILSFGLGVGPVPGLLVPELAPADIRGRAMSFALTTHWVTNFSIGQLFLPSVQSFGIPLVYSFFSLVCFIAIFFVNRFVVETKGKSLEDIEKSLSV